MWKINGMHRKYAVGGKVQSQEAYKTACSALCSFVIYQSRIYFISARSSVILNQSFFITDSHRIVIPSSPKPFLYSTCLYQYKSRVVLQAVIGTAVRAPCC